jgi:hypothetical protein
MSVRGFFKGTVIFVCGVASGIAGLASLQPQHVRDLISAAKGTAREVAKDAIWTDISICTANGRTAMMRVNSVARMSTRQIELVLTGPELKGRRWANVYFPALGAWSKQNTFNRQVRQLGEGFCATGQLPRNEL